MPEPPDGLLPQADDPDAELTMQLLLRAAERYGIETGFTDWQAVVKGATRGQRGSATLAAAAADRALRVVPPRRP